MLLNRHAQQRGLTLIELLVTLAIIGILAGIAWPAYERHNLKQRRAHAVTAVTKISNELQRYFSDNLTYEGYAVSAAITNELKRYTLSLNLAAASYTITATPTGAQVDDTVCANLTLNHLGVKGHTGTATSSAACWGSS